jgi:hypothetical protein
VTNQSYNAQPSNYTDPFWGNEGAGFSLVGGRVTALAQTPEEVYEFDGQRHHVGDRQPYWNYNVACDSTSPPTCPNVTHPDQHAMMIVDGLQDNGTSLLVTGSSKMVERAGADGWNTACTNTACTHGRGIWRISF